mmetsp:Transcript_5504/g.8195  ORF Transcript_5504/g.8195 Transcript_5504/m.8195 type:complete len:395 (+) Transcript_5504:2-1186(+)
MNTKRNMNRFCSCRNWSILQVLLLFSMLLVRHNHTSNTVGDNSNVVTAFTPSLSNHRHCRSGCRNNSNTNRSSNIHTSTRTRTRTSSNAKGSEDTETETETRHEQHERKIQEQVQVQVQFRTGIPSDESTIQSIMVRNLMNPLFIQHERFIVAVNPDDESDIYGFVQIRPIDNKNKNKNKDQDEILLRDPKVYNSKSGSISKTQLLKEELYEDIWDEFENDDSIEFPNGFGSLPWSKEYRDYVKKTEERRQRNLDRMRKIEQDAKDDEKSKRERNKSLSQSSSSSSLSSLWELASVYVRPEWRKKGIGTELVTKVIAKHIMLGRKMEDIYLLTLDSDSDNTVGWYETLGFRITKDIPPSMDLEMAAGGIITKFLGSNLVCMRGDGTKNKEQRMR